jgi:hypothetical protein
LIVICALLAAILGAVTATPIPALSRLARYLAACLALLAAAGGALAQTPPSARVEVAGDAIVFSGRIDRRSVDEFRRALQDHPAVTRLVVTSGGGQVVSALEMGEAVHARQLDVEVPIACLSSCANYVFPAGRRKRLGHALAVGWHGNMTHVIYTQLTGQSSWNDEQMQSARWLARREAEFYPRLGVDGFICWFAKLPPYEVANYYALSASDMAQFGIHDVEVMQGESPPADGDTPVMVKVDFQRLEHERPAMPIEP